MFPVVVALPVVAPVPLCRASVRGLEVFFEDLWFYDMFTSPFRIVFIMTWITLIAWSWQSRIDSRKLRYSFVHFIPKQKTDLGGTSFAKGFKFARRFCLMRSRLNWFISPVDVSSKANESITQIRVSLNFSPFWIGLLHDIIIAYEALITCYETFCSMISVDCCRVARFSLQISGLHSCTFENYN